MLGERQEAAIAILLTDANRRVLLVKRKDTPIWVLPGGGIEAEESPEEACLRELYEESGIEGEVKTKVALLLPQNKLAKKTHLYLCSYRKGTPSLSCESEEVSFFSIHNLPARFFPLHNRWLDYALHSQSKDSLTSPLSEQMALEGASYLEALLFALRHPCLTMRYLFRKN